MSDHSEAFQNIALKITRTMLRTPVPLGERDVNAQSAAPKVSLLGELIKPVYDLSAKLIYRARS